MDIIQEKKPATYTETSRNKEKWALIYDYKLISKKC